MIILGIDPGIAIVGWGVINYENNRFSVIAYGSIQTPADMPTPARLSTIYHDLSLIISRYKPSQLAIEELFFSKNITTGIRVAEARGVILLACEQASIEMFEYTPNQIKQALVGYGKAEKKQVMAMVAQILRLDAPPKPDDTADALAAAICHAHTGCSRMAKYFNTKTDLK